MAVGLATSIFPLYESVDLVEDTAPGLHQHILLRGAAHLETNKKMFRKLKRMDTRRVGLQRPWNDNQLLNWIINFLFTGLALFYIVFFTAFEIPQLVS